MSEQVKHTPGPWSTMPLWPFTVVPTAQIKLGLGASIYEEEDERLFAVEIAEAKCGELSGYAHEIPRETARANARLIAAAPDLLDALQMMTSAFEAFRMKPVGAPGSAARDEQDQQIAAENAASAAIAKATGGA